MNKVKIQKIEPMQIVATSETNLEVTAEFTIGGEVFIKKLGYAEGTTAAAIKADLKKHLTTELQERKQRESQQKVDAQTAETQETISNLQGEEIVDGEKPVKKAKTPAKKTNANRTKKS